MPSKRQSQSPEQLELVLFDRYAELAKRLEKLCGIPLDVQFHRNRWTYVSCEDNRRSRRLRVRLHECFLDAPENVTEALAVMFRDNGKAARRTIREFVNEQSRIWDSDEPVRRRTIQTVGKVYDLTPIFEEINQHYFDGQCKARITWGKRLPVRYRQRQITFGSYEDGANLIRINPILDRKRVPKYFLRFIVYHEMLHAVVPSPLSPKGKRLYHSRLFRQRERLFEDYGRARAWERRFLGETGQ